MVEDYVKGVAWYHFNPYGRKIMSETTTRNDLEQEFHDHSVYKRMCKGGWLRTYTLHYNWLHRRALAQNAGTFSLPFWGGCGWIATNFPRRLELPRRSEYLNGSCPYCAHERTIVVWSCYMFRKARLWVSLKLVVENGPGSSEKQLCSFSKTSGWWVMILSLFKACEHVRPSSSTHTHTPAVQGEYLLSSDWTQHPVERKRAQRSTNSVHVAERSDKISK